MLHAIPALPVRDLKRSVAFYRDHLGFALAHGEAGSAVLRRDAVELHLWTAGDEAWRQRDALPPVLSGAESFLEGTASCRIAVTDVDALHEALQPLGVLHPNAPLRDMGRAGLINSGGPSGSNDFVDAVTTAVLNKRAGGTGLISGRKAFQRPMKDGVRLLNLIQDVYLDQSITVA